MLINYISNLPLSEVSGGWSGINFRIYSELKKHFKVNYVGPINPKPYFIEKIYSKICRLLGFRGNYFFFSEKRLAKISSQLSREIDENAKYNFFFGQTPWIKYIGEVPFGCYIDADFRTYLKIFLNLSSFKEEDVKRIQKGEESWLLKSTDMFMGSDWAWEQMEQYYKLDYRSKCTVHVGGNIKVPKNDLYSDGYSLTFISLNFLAKGGLICFEVFKQLKNRYPEVSLNIIGQKPPEEILKEKNVVYHGLLDKNNTNHLEVFCTILEQSFFLVHPTKMDTMGAVIIESGYFGCPSIAPKSFGIPELIVDGKTGVLVNDANSVEDYFEKIEYFIANPETYYKMRYEVKKFTSNELTYTSIGNKIKTRIEQSVLNAQPE